MTAEREVLVPDIGDFKDIDVIEILVKPGDTIQVETPLITIESDKAAMEVPSPYAGIVKDIRVKVGEKVAEGSAILVLSRQRTMLRPRTSRISRRQRPHARHAQGRSTPCRPDAGTAGRASARCRDGPR